MPYITQERRDKLDRVTKYPETAGELNYLLTQLVHRFIRSQGLKYETFNAAIGALESSKLELYRRFIAPYEDQKILENGDVKL